MHLHIEIHTVDAGYRITTFQDGGSGWGVGVIFPTKSGAEDVAATIAQNSGAERSTFAFDYDPEAASA